MKSRGMKRQRAGRSKASAQYLHAKKRAAERYGLELTKEHYQTLCLAIQRGEGTFLGRQSNRVSVWQITVYRASTNDFPKVNVVYDRQRHTIVTFLPPGITDANGVAL